MKKITVFLLMFFLSSQIGNCTLTDKEINVYNLKRKNMYILNLNSPLKNMNVSNGNIVGIMPVTSLTDDKKQLFIEAEDTGVCDVLLTTEAEIYKIRFISGPVFQDDKSELLQIDIPIDYENGIEK